MESGIYKIFIKILRFFIKFYVFEGSLSLLVLIYYI